MTIPGVNQLKLDKRQAVCKLYSGPRSGMYKDLRPFMGWTFKHYRWSLPNVTVCYADRATTELVGIADPPIEVEFRLDLDRHLPYDIGPPEGATVKDLPAETLLTKSFKGDPGEFMSDLLFWLKNAETAYQLKPGYRQRLAKIGSPESPDWEIEVQVVLA